MSKADKTALEDLHAKLASTLADALEGVPVEVEGVMVKAPPPAAILNVARQFLKDNDITSTTHNPAMQRLADAAGAVLPFPAHEETDEHGLPN